jgi:hypothetical protein
VYLGGRADVGVQRRVSQKQQSERTKEESEIDLVMKATRLEFCMSECDAQRCDAMWKRCDGDVDAVSNWATNQFVGGMMSQSTHETQLEHCLIVFSTSMYTCH